MTSTTTTYALFVKKNCMISAHYSDTFDINIYTVRILCSSSRLRTVAFASLIGATRTPIMAEWFKAKTISEEGDRTSASSRTRGRTETMQREAKGEERANKNPRARVVEEGKEEAEEEEEDRKKGAPAGQPKVKKSMSTKELTSAVINSG